jgi:DNA-binding SARP family transcriptional activator
MGVDVALPAKQRVVLAKLLLQANRIVTLDAMIDALWDGAPPARARVTVQGYVSRLRQVLGDAAGGPIITRQPGYVLAVSAGELDVDRFTELYGQARSAVAGGAWRLAVARLDEALALWRGDPLADVPSAVLQRTEVPRLAELRLRAFESRFDAELRLGRHAELVAEIRKLASGEPLREGLHGQLMLALYGCGQQAEALEAFRRIDQRLRSELGIDAGPDLGDLHQRMVAADPSLLDCMAPVSDVRPAGRGGRPVLPG